MIRLEGEVTSRGSIEQVSPTIGDIHRVSNASLEEVSISIHVYGGNIGKIKRHAYDLKTGTATHFVSGYSNLS
jgi:predicted metal-dependent enzyme (double-stranded beta helix superfamily)